MDIPDLDAKIERVVQLERERDEAIARLTVLVEVFDGDCRLDHHGFCQQHLITKPCEIMEARRFLRKVNADD